MKIAIYFLLAVFLNACHATRNDHSKIDHVFGQTKRERHDPLKNCHSFQESTPELAKIDSYLRGLMKTIIEANPSTFQGFYKSENFCIEVNKDMDINAYAWPSSGNVVFNLATILNAGSDAEIAGVLAHELAHVTMNSPGYGEEHPDLKNDREWAAEKAKYENEAATIDRKIQEERDNGKQYYDNRKKVIGDFKKLVDKVLMDAFDAANLGRDLLLKQLSDLELKRREFVSNFDTLRKDPRWPTFTDDEKNKLEAEFEKKNLQMVEEIMRVRDAADKALFQVYHLQKQVDVEIDKLVRRNLHPILRKLWDANQEKIREYDDRIARLEEEKSEKYLALTRFASKKIGYGYDVSNWMESEADEAGLELYVRAGFDPLFFNKLEEFFMNPDELRECRSLVARSIDNPTVPAPLRGDRTHPADCFRIFDAQVLAERDHPEMVELFKNAKTINVFEGELQKVKAGF